MSEITYFTAQDLARRYSVKYLTRLIPLTPGLRNMVTCGAPRHKNK